jgi:hypothetical protein
VSDGFFAREVPKILLVFLFGLVVPVSGGALIVWRDVGVAQETLRQCGDRIKAVEELGAAIAIENAQNSMARTEHAAAIARIADLLSVIRADVAAVKVHTNRPPYE